MYYPDELVEQVRLSNDVVDVISSYVRLQKKGSTHFGLCPFHNEKSPSFSVTPSKQMYYCFGCGAGGNVFTFIMEYENYTFQEAIKYLADRASISLPEIEYSKEAKEQQSRRSKLLEVTKVAATYYFHQLETNNGKIGYQYLRGRELADDTIKKFGLGFSLKSGAGLHEYLKSKGYAQDILREAGLINIDEQRGIYDKFWNRVMFPILDVNHRVIGFGGRTMGDGKPKYINSPETSIFDKSRNLYGLNIARTSRKSNIIVCEGYMDVISLHQVGFNQAVASLGTAFTSGHANLLRRYTEEVLLVYDSDGAGVSASLRALPILKAAGLSGKVVSLNPYKDPDDFIKALGAEAFQERLEKAENSFFFEIRILEASYNLADPEGKTKFYQEIARRLCLFEEEMERDNYLQAIADKYHIGYENMKKLVVGYASKTGLVREARKFKSGIQSKKTPEEASKKTQRLLLTWLSEEPHLYQKIERYVTPQDFTTELYQKVATELFREIKESKLEPARIISLFTDEEEQREVASLFNTRLEELDTKVEKERAFHDILVGIKRNSYEYYCGQMGSDVSALTKVIEGKKALEELCKTHISID